MELDKDLAARQEARLLCRQAESAQKLLGTFPQEKLDAIVENIAKKFSAAADELAWMAVEETGFGNAADKVIKNRFASEKVARAVRDMKTVGLLREIPEQKLWEIGVPMGVIAAIVLLEMFIYVGILNNINGVYIIPVSDTLGISRGDYSLAFSAR